jgi:hemolysin D
MLRRKRTPSYLIEPWQSKTDAVLARRGPSLGSPAVGTLVLMVAVLGGIAPFVEIDRTVSSTGGKIVATESISTFQALDPSIIKSIDVKEGDEVTKGQLLATLDPTFAAADVVQLQRHLAALDALIARAKAEQAGTPLETEGSGSADAGPYTALQASLFAGRAAQLRAQVLSLDEKIKAAQASVARVQADEGHLTDRVKIAKQVEGMRDTLYKSGSTSLLNLLEASDSSLEMQRSLDNDQNSLVELQHQITSLKADRESAVRQWFTASSQELIGAENERDTTRASLDKALKHQDLVRLVASQPSMVLTLTKLSAGSVLKEGDPVMSLMPLGAPIKAEIHFSADDIGFVRPGNRVTVKVDAFNYIEHGTAEGHLDWISEGSFTTDDNGKPVPAYYRARVSLDKMNFINVPAGFRLIPGMTLTADIDVGKRSLSRFVAGTLFHGLGEAMREP